MSGEIMNYGLELVIDLHNCNTLFTRETITQFMEELCELINMERADLHFWDYETQEEKDEVPDHLAGTSAIQFITTSNITIHTLDRLRAVYLNIFTCSSFNASEVLIFCEEFWEGHSVCNILLERQ